MVIFIFWKRTLTSFKEVTYEVKKLYGIMNCKMSALKLILNHQSCARSLLVRLDFRLWCERIEQEITKLSNLNLNQNGNTVFSFLYPARVPCMLSFFSSFATGMWEKLKRTYRLPNFVSQFTVLASANHSDIIGIMIKSNVYIVILIVFQSLNWRL